LPISGGSAGREKRARKPILTPDHRFAREIALYARKYVSSESALRERLRRDSATLDKLWKVER
jgi:hypothetical protein